ncbi:MAG: hypothetical protein P8M07_02355 [Flavobacteriales bacterium]|nr:hypothetical protein [Flavobacteriales bacterium]
MIFFHEELIISLKGVQNKGSALFFGPGRSQEFTNPADLERV